MLLMNWFALGFAELRREFTRVYLRCLLARLRSRLGKLETVLGELGWQQADYGPDLEPVIAQIQEIENREVTLFNESAGVGRSLARLKSNREIGRKDFEASLKTLLADARPSAERLEAAKRELAESSTVVTECEAQIGRLRSQFRSASSEMDRFMLKAEEHGFVEQRLALLDQKNAAAAAVESCETKLATSSGRRMQLQKEIEALEQEQIQWKEKESALRAEFAEADSALARQIEKSLHGKAKLEKGIDEMERSKKECFLAVGQALADNGIAPINQPEALTAVLETRNRIMESEFTISSSLELSRQMQFSDIFTFHLVFWSVLALVVSVVVMLV